MPRLEAIVNGGESVYFVGVAPDFGAGWTVESTGAIPQLVCAAPTIVRPPQPSEMPRIVRLREDSTTVLPASPTEEFSAATTALRIQRREPPSDTTARRPAPPHDDATKAP